MRLHKDIFFSILLILAMVSWGISWTSAKIMGQYIDATTAIFYRFLFSTISFFPIFPLLKLNFSFKEIPLKMVAICSAILGLYNYYFFTGTNIGLAGIGGVLVTTTNPLVTMVLMAIIGKRYLTKRELFGITLGMLGGCFIINIWQLGWTQIFQSGNIYFILCATIWAVLTILISKTISPSQSIHFTFLMYVGTTIMAFPFISTSNVMAIFSFDSIFWIHFFIVSVGALTFGTTTYFVASQKLGPEKSSSYIFTVPVSALLTSMILLQETLDLFTFIGCVLTICAVIIINR
jgi:drug/metabolite transporter (DMT)-like permease